MKHLILFFTVFICFMASANAQKLSRQELVDSLLAELPKAKEDTNKVRLLQSISLRLQPTNPDRGLEYGLQALELSGKLGWVIGKQISNIAIGDNHEAKGNNTKAIEYYTTALKFAEERKSKGAIAICHKRMGVVAANLGNYSKALEYYLMALPVYKATGNSDLDGLLDNIGSLYNYMRDYTKALEYHKQALKLGEERGDKNTICVAKLNIGWDYLDGFGDYPKALEHFVSARKIAKEIGYKPIYITATGNIGVIYWFDKNYKMALACYMSAARMHQKIGNKQDYSVDLYNIGDLYLTIVQEMDSKKTGGSLPETIIEGLPRVTIPKSKAALLDEAEKYLKQSLNLGIEVNDLVGLKDCYQELSDVYELRGDYKRSLEAHRQFVIYNDSVFNRENTEKIAKLESKAEYEKKQVADSIQNAEAQKLVELKLQRQRTMTYGGIGAAILLLAFSIFIFRNNKKLGIEKEKSETLLHNILPEEIADELKDRGATTAQHFDQVTVLFTDFVNFTTAGERMGSQALVEELHECFKAFDEIMEKYGIEKIKTIGDAYLAVCGLPTADERHAEKTVQAAHEIKAFMLQRSEQLGDKTFEVRIGVHSGSVVAGIVGVKKFAYDIWGDTVNTAARMEQNSEAGKINISQTTYELVQDKFNCTYRGELEAKNKGKLKMYFVEA